MRSGECTSIRPVALKNVILTAVKLVTSDWKLVANGTQEFPRLKQQTRVVFPRYWARSD